MQTPPAAANLPGAQLVQLLAASDPAAENVPVEQLVQTEGDEAPVVVE